jgi:hypothetical protein
MVVVMIVRTPPDTTRAQGIDSKCPHQNLCQARPGKDRMMLLIVVDHKHPQQKETRQNAEYHFGPDWPNQ